MEQKYRQAATIDFINRSFRDVADKDYIAARIVHRYDLNQQFLWLALQAIEKYLKAILLYNKKDTKSIGHSILDAYNSVVKIPGIKFDFPKDIEDFIKYLNDQGPNRYFEYPYYTLGEELLYLDRTVWYIRRYCYYLRGTEVELFPYEIQEIQSPDTLKHPNKYRIFGGFLENVLQEKSILRDQLIWKNFYFGTYKKKVIKRYRVSSGSGNPTHFLHPEIFSELEKTVSFSKPVRDYFKNLKNKQRN